MSGSGKTKHFVLSGWGKATSLAPDRENVFGADAADGTPTFALLAKVTYSDDSIEYFRANFNRFDTNWQFAAVPVMIASGKNLKSIAISAEYCYNNGDAMFTGIRFAKDDFSFTENKASGVLNRKAENGAVTTCLKYEGNRPVRIKTVDRFGKTVSQKMRYDCKGNLLYAEDSLGNVLENEYDGNGNIQVRREYPYTVGELTSAGTECRYAYGIPKRDRLLSVGGESISYDAMGNPTSYRGKTLTFTRCHLVSALGDTTFSYDGDGNRVKKAPQNGTATEYFYANDTLYKEKTGTASITFHRDEAGEVCLLLVNGGTPYLLRKNAQGDVVAASYRRGVLPKTDRFGIFPKKYRKMLDGRRRFCI